MTLRTLNYGNYGIFLIMGHAGFLSINRIARPFVCEMAFGAEGLAGSFAHLRKFEATRTWGAGSSPNSYRSRKYRALNCKPIRGSFAFWGWAFLGMLKAT